MAAWVGGVAFILAGVVVAATLVRTPEANESAGPPTTTPPELESTTSTAAAVDTSVFFALATGTCFDDPESFEQVTDVPVVDCSEPHDNEVIGSFDLPAGGYPGDAAVASGAEGGCLERFEPYVGIDFPSSIYDLGWFTPTSNSWDVGDREVICFVYDVTFAKITGSVVGSAA